jgi:carboxymethylenebutenolidase
VVTGKAERTPKQPMASIELARNLFRPLPGLSGDEDRAPTPEPVDQHEAERKQQGRQYAYRRYDGARRWMMAATVRCRSSNPRRCAKGDQ